MVTVFFRLFLIYVFMIRGLAQIHFRGQKTALLIQHFKDKYNNKIFYQNIAENDKTMLT